MNRLELVQTVNTLVQVLGQMGVGWTEFTAMVHRAQVEGRKFDQSDLDQLSAKAQSALDRLGGRLGLEHDPNA